MPPLAPDHLEEIIAKAMAQIDLAPHYNQVSAVLDHLAEALTQGAINIVWHVRDDTRKKIASTMLFYSGIIGHLAHLEGSPNEASVYHSYDTDQGNQIDMFLERIGYKI